MAAKNGECHLKIKQLTIKFYLIGLCGYLRSEKFCGYLRSEKFSCKKYFRTFLQTMKTQNTMSINDWLVLGDVWNFYNTCKWTHGNV